MYAKGMVRKKPVDTANLRENYATNEVNRIHEDVFDILGWRWQSRLASTRVCQQSQDSAGHEKIVGTKPSTLRQPV